MLPYVDFLDRVLADGIEAAKADYANDLVKLQGAWEGFAQCRNKTPAEILALWEQAHREAETAALNRAVDYWRLRCRAGEIEFTLNVLSAALCVPLLAWLPTARGVLCAARILGVGGEGETADGPL